MANLYYASQYFTTTLSVVGGIDASQTTDIVLQSVTGIDDTTKPGIALINYSNPLNESIAEWVTFTSINSTTKELQGVTRGAEKGSAKTHSNGVTVAFPISESHINNIADRLTGVDTTLASDTNGNELIKTSTTASAVNELTVTNAATGNAPEISATGGDTNIDLKLKGKGTGHPLVYDQSRGEYHPAIMYRTNFIINGNMDIWQRGTSFTASANNDDVYTADRWNLISDGNDAVDITREATEKPDGSMYSMKLDTETAKRYGVVQFIENIDSKKLDNKNVSLSFAAKTTSSQVTTLRAAVLTWGSTADAVTSDVVGTWDATPTWAANWTAENIPADITITDSWATYTIEGIAIDTATVNNIAVVIWTPNAETIGDVWYLSQVQLTEGKDALPFQPKSYAQELADCQRYCIAYTTTDNSEAIANGGVITTTVARILFQFPVEMRDEPTLTATASDWQVEYAATGTDMTNIAIATNQNGKKSPSVDCTVASGLTVGQYAKLRGDTTPGRLLYFSAEL